MPQIAKFFLFSLFLVAQPPFAADLDAWLNYAESIKTCKQGTFLLPDPLLYATSQKISFITYKIIGWRSGACQITIKREANELGGFSDAISNCTFTKENLASLSQSASDIATGTITISTDTPANEIMTNSCSQ